jgi:hypothetical protein
MRFRGRTAFTLALAAIAAGCSASSGTEPATDGAVGDTDSPKDTAAPGDAKADAHSTPDPVDALARGRDVAEDEASGEGNTADAFVPGPVEPLVVGSGNSANYDLAPGTWKVFSFATVAEHLYCISGLGSDVVGYLGSSSSVSPTNYVDKTNSNGILAISEYSNGERYIAVAASANAASGSFQVADGGELLTVGENTVDFTPTGQDNYRVFRFTVAPGHNYAFSVTGEAKGPVGLGLSPKAERTIGGQIAFPFSETSGPLPINAPPIPFESTVESYTRFYFAFLKVQETVSLTITITLAS